MFCAVDCGQETEWVEQVKRELPADRLLVFEVKDVWGLIFLFQIQYLQRKRITDN